MSECPCRECVAPKRHIACHGSCTEFATYNEARLKAKKEKRIAQNHESLVANYVIEQTKKQQRKKQYQYAKKPH